MKAIDIKSLLLGVCVTLLIISLTSGKKAETTDNLVPFSHGAGFGIFNNNTKQMFLYRQSGFGISDPDVYQVLPDGSDIKKVKK
jgi:hypothetical protein